MPTTEARACAILTEFGRAQAELVGKSVILTSGEAGTIDSIWLDEFHGLRISIKGHEGQWPISTIKLAQPDVLNGISRRRPIFGRPVRL